MTHGIVKWFNKAKGFGFIMPESGGEDVFVHITVLEKAGIRYLDENQKIIFETEIKNGRLRANFVELKEGENQNSDQFNESQHHEDHEQAA